MKIENTQVYGLENAIRCAKFPMTTNPELMTSELTKGIAKLGRAAVGSGHDNMLNGIIVQFDLTSSLKFNTEWQRYHFADYISSCSTIHCITKFDLRRQCNEYVDPRIIDILQDKINRYNQLIDYDKKNEPSDTRTNAIKELYLEILYNVPTGFELTAGITTNYRQLKTIYYQRRHHKLPEWHMICDWIEELPKFKELCLEEK